MDRFKGFTEEHYNKIQSRAKRMHLMSKATKLAKKHAGDMTHATNEIDKLAKGLSDHPVVQRALQKHNESVDEMSKIGAPKTYNINKRKVTITKKGDKWHASLDGADLGHHDSESDAMKRASKKIYTKEAKDPGEYDQEGGMAKSQLKTMLDAAKELHDMFKDNDNLPEWVQGKITKATDYIDSARDYMKSQTNEARDPRAQKAHRDMFKGAFKKAANKKKSDDAAARLIAKGYKRNDRGGWDLPKEEVNEAVDRANSEGRGKGYTASHEKSSKGYRAVMKDPNGKTSYLGSKSYKTKDAAEGEAKAYHKGYFSHPQKRTNDRGAQNAVHQYRQDNKQHHVEEAQLDELSPKTLGSYVKKAKDDMRINTRIAGDFKDMAKRSRKAYHKAGAERVERDFNKRVYKRSKNIDKAVDKLTKEDNINELSPALATRAANKASKEYDHYKKTKNGAMAYHRGSQARSFKHYAKSGEYYSADR